MLKCRRCSFTRPTLRRAASDSLTECGISQRENYNGGLRSASVLLGCKETAVHCGSESICAAALRQPCSSPPPPPVLVLFVVTSPLYFSLCELYSFTPPPLPVSLRRVYCCHLTSPTNGTPDFWPPFKLLLMMPSLMIRHSASVTALRFVFFIIPVFGSSIFLPARSVLFLRPSQTNSAATEYCFYFYWPAVWVPHSNGPVFFHNTGIKNGASADIDCSAGGSKMLWIFHLHSKV